ncbi:MAG: hypothetical protein ACRC6I_11060 [Paracoccaceae bacterium]
MSANIMRMRRMAEEYMAGRISSLVILFSFSYAADLLDGFLLRIKDKAALRLACLKATEDTPDAYWDENAYWWITDDAAITRNFIEEQFATLSAEDQDSFCRWLENGHGRELRYDLARSFWFSAMIWAGRSHEFPDRMEAMTARMSPEQIGFALDFCKAYDKAALDMVLLDACAEVCKLPGDDMDLFQMTKFHVVWPDDDAEEDEVNFFERDPFQNAHSVRDGNVLRRQLAPIIAKGNPWEIDALDQMVRSYVETESHSRELAVNVGQTEAYAAANLYHWSRDA